MWWIVCGIAAFVAALGMLRRRRAWSADGKRILVTGGSQGLGLALAQQLAAGGAHVVLCSRTASKLEEAAEVVRHVSYVAADVASWDGAAAAVAQCPWPVDAVFCCAGGAKPGWFLEHTAEDFELGMRLDYQTALATSHAVARSMKAHNVRGKIVFVSSVLGMMGLVGYTQYSPMKYAIRGLAECLRSELALYGISVHIYFPATILSPGYEQENRTKPALTREIEGADEGQTPAQCAQHMLRGVERDYFAITDGLIGQFLRISSAGCAPGHVWALDTLLALPARWALAGWRRFVADATVHKHAQNRAN